MQVLDGAQLSNITLPIDPDGFMSLANPQANDPSFPGQFPSPIPTLNRVLRGGDLPTLGAINTGDITMIINSASPQAATAFKFASKAVKLLSFDGKNPIDVGNAVDQGLNKLLEVGGDILDKPDLKPLLDATNLVLGEIMEPIKKVLAFLSTLGPLPKLDVHMVSNRIATGKAVIFHKHTCLIHVNIGCRLHNSRQPHFQLRDISELPSRPHTISHRDIRRSIRFLHKPHTAAPNPQHKVRS
jgi:hypothetical protein